MTNEKGPGERAPSLNGNTDDSSHDSRISQLRAYLSRGWALVPLHDVGRVVGGQCSCRAGADCRSAGKHPRSGAEWQRPENLIWTAEQLDAALARWPLANWGLATGLISNVWALDFDPKNVEDPAAVAAVWAILASHAATWTQRTGSGGTHHVFALPPDFVPNNGKGRLPAGFDVRGARRGEPGGGQIVLSPSVSAIGAYEVIMNGPVLNAPAELLDMVRPAPPRERIGGAVFSAPSRDAAGAYVAAAVNGELAQMRALMTGRNNRAWTAAARCVELINTGLVDRDTVYAAWWAATEAHPDPSITVPNSELLRLWASAERHVGDRPADLSGVGGPSGWSFGGEGITGPSPALAATPLPGGSAGAVLPAFMLGGGAPGGAGSYPQPAGNPVDDGRDKSVTAQVSPVTSESADPVEAMLAQLLDIDGLRAVEPPQPLINGVLDLDTTSWLIGESGSYKSFVALDFAAHVGLGRAWRGHEVHQGEVLYVVAEGARGMRLRVDAWEREHGPMKAVRFLPMPVQANTPAWDVLVEVCRRIGPVLVIIDTQARVTLGLEENSNSDMGVYVERVDQIKRATGACVLTVHHLGRGGTNARGASAIDGAQDAEIRVEKKGTFMIHLVMDKQKDQAEAAPEPIRLKLSAGGADPVTGRDLSSLVLDHALMSLGEADALQQGTKDDRRARLMYALVRDEFNPGEGGSRDEIRSAFRALPDIASETPAAQRQAAHRAWTRLVSLGIVMRRLGMQRFKVLVLDDLSPAGWLTSNRDEQAKDAPEGFEIWWPDMEQAASHSKSQLERTARHINGQMGSKGSEQTV